MKLSTTSAGIVLAVAAAGMLGGCSEYGTRYSSMAATEQTVHCYGVNKCKGYNDCKTASNACKGKASCKGQGFVNMSEKACTEMGGTVGS